MAEVNKYLRKLRKEKGVTQSLISKQTGISLSLISKFDNSKCNISESKLSNKGKQISPSNIALIKQLAQALAGK